jgi:ribonuclease HI
MVVIDSYFLKKRIYLLRSQKVKWQLFVDGASRNNPGPSGAGIYLIKDGKKEFAQGFFLGKKTNNQAEYLALLLGILITLPRVRSDHFQIVSDSLLLVNQTKGIYKIKNPQLKFLSLKILEILGTSNYDIVHVLRAKNKMADEMANLGVDRRVSITPELREKLIQYEVDI